MNIQFFITIYYISQTYYLTIGSFWRLNSCMNRECVFFSVYICVLCRDSFFSASMRYQISNKQTRRPMIIVTLVHDHCLISEIPSENIYKIFDSQLQMISEIIFGNVLKDRRARRKFLIDKIYYNGKYNSQWFIYEDIWRDIYKMTHYRENLYAFACNLINEVYYTENDVK